MENNKKVNFIRINHKNRIDYFTEEKLVEFKMNLFTKLSNMQERDFSQNLNNYMENFIPNFTDDPLELNLKIAKKFYENNPNLKFERKCPEMLLVMDKLLNHNFNMEFKCNEVFVSFLSRALIFCFRDMKANSKFYSIKNFADFKNKIKDIIYEDVNLHEYVVISKDEDKQAYKKSRNSGKIVQSFTALDDIEINLNNPINSKNDSHNINKNDNYNNNNNKNSKLKEQKNKKVIDFKDIEITSNIAMAKMQEAELASTSHDNESNLLLNSKLNSESNLINKTANNNDNNTNNNTNNNLSSTSYFNYDSRKSSFKSNGDYNNSTTKKSTFSSNNCNVNNNKINANADIIITLNSKFREGDGTEETEDKKENNANNKNNNNDNLLVESQASSKEFKIEKGYLNDLSIEQQQYNKTINQTNKILNSKRENNLEEEASKEKISLKKFSTESIITPVKVKRHSCQILKAKNTQKELEKPASSSKKHTNTVIEKSEAEQKNKNYFLNKTEKKTSSKTNDSFNNLKNSSSKKFILNTAEARRKSNTTTDKNNNIPKGKSALNFSNASEFFKFNFSHIINSKKNIYVEYKSDKEFDKYGIPIYFILLAQKLMTIKKLTITIPKNLKNNGSNNNNNNFNYNNNNSTIDNYAIILLNLEWLFQNLLEIEIDFGVGSKSQFDKLFKVKFNKEANDIAYGKKFRNAIEEYKQSFELLLLASNLAAKHSNLYIFTLNNYSCYYFELDFLTRMYHKELRFIHILDIFNNYINLVRLNVNFNALDSFTFERIINLIQINNNLKCVNFDFRIDGEDFSVESLKRIYMKHYLYSNSQCSQAGCLIEKPDFNKIKSESGLIDNSNDTTNILNNQNNNNNNTYGAYLHNIYQSGFGFFKKSSNESVDIIKTDDNNYNNHYSNYNYKSFVANNNYHNSNYKTSFIQGNANTKNSLQNNTYTLEEIDEKLNNQNFNVTTSHFAPSAVNDIQSVLDFLEEDNENKFMGLIMKKFEPLLEELFFIIESKKNLMELNFNITLPNIISSNDNFIMTLQKFIFNIFKSLDNHDCSLKTIKIKSPYLCFNNRKYPVIEKFINTIDLQKNNSSINNFTLDIQINKIPNIVNLIPRNVQFLYLGEFDIETFICFKKNFIEKNNFLNSHINSLTVSFNGSIIDKALLINEFKYIYNSEKPVSLKEIQILSNLIVDKFSLKEILLSIKSDDIEKYYFEFNKLSLENFNYFRSNMQKINLKNDKDKVKELKLNYFFNIVKKYKENIETNISRKIVYNIIRFVTPIYVTNIEIKFRE